jgi:hypothetical protein
VDAVDDPVAIPCFAALLHEYYTLSEHLPRFDDRLFLSSFADRAHEGKLWGLSSDRLAKLMKAAMIAAGIPAEFLPHSARHAGIAHWRGQGMTDDDVMHRANMHAATYVRHYRRRIRTNAAVC